MLFLVVILVTGISYYVSNKYCNLNPSFRLFVLITIKTSHDLPSRIFLFLFFLQMFYSLNSELGRQPHVRTIKHATTKHHPMGARPSFFVFLDTNVDRYQVVDEGFNFVLPRRSCLYYYTSHGNFSSRPQLVGSSNSSSSFSQSRIFFL